MSNDLMWIALEQCNGNPADIAMAVDHLLTESNGAETTLTAALRWMMREGKWPRLDSAVQWFLEGAGLIYPELHRVPMPVFCRLPADLFGADGVETLNHDLRFMEYNTFRESIEALAFALDDLQKADPRRNARPKRIIR